MFPDFMATSNRPVSFYFAPNRTAKTVALLRALGRGGPREVAAALNDGAFIWHAEIVKHTPVDEGLLRASWAIALASAEQQGDNVHSRIGSNVPYSVFIEFGTKWIAGGAVKSWRAGQQPILDWPAKRAGQAKFDNLHGAAKAAHEKKIAREQKAGREEFMPPMRGSWPLVQLKVQERLKKRLQDLMQREARKAG